MGAIITIRWQTQDPMHQEKIRDLAAQLEGIVGESVQVDIALVDNQGSPNTIEVGRILEKERLGLR